MTARDMVVSLLLSELETWRANHPSGTVWEQREAFPMAELWRRVDAAFPAGPFDQPLYRRLLELAGYSAGAADATQGGWRPA